ncbi:unnamed protein product [Urochloa decumbens]|uniref:RING-type domain-containing protein n=1 Tax=Urochloa decumbens TaxID=240449 RepID=A0ABC8XQ02_9POAL
MSSSSSASAVPPEDDVCSVCHDRFRIPCQANCSHWFCGECIIRVWHHGPAVQACKCPICRRLINLLVPAPLSDQEDHPQVNRILGEIQHYNCIFGGAPRSLTQVARPTFLHPKTVQRNVGSPEDSTTCVQGTDDDDGCTECNLCAEPYRHSPRKYAGALWIR